MKWLADCIPASPPLFNFIVKAIKIELLPIYVNIMLMLYALVYSSIFMDGSGGVQSRREKK